MRAALSFIAPQPARRASGRKARRGAKKAILTVAASMLTAAFHMLRDGVEYADLGADYLDRQDRSKTVRRLLQRLQDLGCDVPIELHAA